jgi:ABC-type glycerol-3-phosphate transport system substrate-binding protein
MQSGFTGAYTGKTYAVGETVEFLDKLKINQGDSVEPDNLGGFKVNGTSLSTELTAENAIRDSVLQAEESGVLAELPSTKTAIRRFANLAGSNTLDVSPQPNDLKNVTSFSQFVVGEIAMIIETAANIPSAQNLAEFEWGVAPLPQYKQYVDPTDGANDEVVVMGKESGHAESVSVSIREKSVKKELAGKFIEFLVGEQGQALKLAQGLVPNQRSVAENAAYNFNYMNVFLRAMDNQKAGDWWYMPDVRWISVWADRLNGEVRNGTMDLEAWFTNYIAPTNEILSEYVVAIED